MCLLLVFSLAGAGAAQENENIMNGDGIAQVLRAGGDYRYARTEKGVVLFSADRGRSWENRSAGLPVKKVWPFNGEERRACTSLAVYEGDWRRVAATTNKHLYLSTDAGRNWRRIPLRDPVNGSIFLTSVAFAPDDPQVIYLGTSFNGVYMTRDGGAHWTQLSELLAPLQRGAGFYEEITDMTLSSGEKEVLYLASRFERVLYRFDTRTTILTKIPFPEELEGFYGLSGRTESGTPVELHADSGRYVYRSSEGEWRGKPALLLKNGNTPAAGDGGGSETATRPDYFGRRGIYLNSWNAQGTSLERHLDFMEQHDFDTIVVDVKNDRGKLTYRSNLDAPRRYGAVQGRLNLQRLLEKAHARGFYVVGRMVVFKDEVLYHAKGGSQAVWNKQRGEPWGHKVERTNPETGESEMVQREYWVDPFSEFVWDYNIDIAKEAARIGLDEIQFDYIRFPSDGNLRTVSYRHRRAGMLKSEAIESFLRKASRELEVPISTDLYGFNSWYRMGNWIGQDIGMISRYADVICPMYYPSHFPASFLESDDYLQRAYTLYRNGTRRARRLVEGRSVIRPYVQAFRVGWELKMEEEVYHRYLSMQLEGIFDAGGSGYTLWNNANRYYMVDGSISVLNGANRDGTVQRRMAGP